MIIENNRFAAEAGKPPMAENNKPISGGKKIGNISTGNKNCRQGGHFRCCGLLLLDKDGSTGSRGKNLFLIISNVECFWKGEKES
jgi:hypothetical protein